jgi:hypothetical protein
MRRIAMAAAANSIAPRTLQMRATRRSDVRCILAVLEPDGRPVPPRLLGMELDVKIGAPDLDAERLRALVASNATCLPVTGAVKQAVPVAMHVAVAEEAAE